ncbi:hypothetical protein SAY86_019317 [Trapa natans]|uniref:Uncharacterized protein n=1 Tax=Trapa natans TaxID=22666 RepID=A0AAN7R6R8_TRANT|nr:hypothetical protein SAY86_019317 [Trapa natans]
MAIVVRQNGRENCGPLRALRDLQEAFSSRRLFPTTREAQRGADETENWPNMSSQLQLDVELQISDSEEVEREIAGEEECTGQCTDCHFMQSVEDSRCSSPLVLFIVCYSIMNRIMAAGFGL